MSELKYGPVWWNPWTIGIVLFLLFVFTCSPKDCENVTPRVGISTSKSGALLPTVAPPCPPCPKCTEKQ